MVRDNEQEGCTLRDIFEGWRSVRLWDLGKGGSVSPYNRELFVLITYKHWNVLKPICTTQDPATLELPSVLDRREPPPSLRPCVKTGKCFQPTFKRPFSPILEVSTTKTAEGKREALEKQLTIEVLTGS